MKVMNAPRVLNLLCPLSACPFIASLCSGLMAGISGQSRYPMSLGSVCETQVAESVTGYWSSSPNANNSNNAWIVNFNNGNDNNNNRNNNNAVRLVRGG
jgi:hypothetical protein